MIFNTLLFLYIFTPVILAIVINGIIFILGWNKNRLPKYTKLPKGWIIGIVWTVLLGLLGYALYLERNITISFWALCILIFVCLTYPFYTQGLQENVIMKYANSGVLVLTFIILGILLLSISVTKYQSIVFVIPLLLWLLYVNALDYDII